MNTINLKITGNEDSINEALVATEKLAVDGGLDKKQCLHLRLLAEELFGMIRSITREVKADYVVNQDGKSYELHLETEVELTMEMREEMLSVSSSGKNEAAKGFMGKLRDVIRVSLLPSENLPGISERTGLGLMNMGETTGSGIREAGVGYEWSMSVYKDNLESKRRDETEEAWDELEKSIVANIADEVKVYIKRTKVHAVIMKTF